MSNKENNEQSTELAYPNETNNTIRLTLADNRSDKENNPPTIQTDDIIIDIKPVYQTHDKEDYGGTEGTSSQYHGHQTLPTDITPTPMDLTTQGITGSNGETLSDSNHHIPLQEICDTGYPTRHRSFDHFRSLENINQKIIQLSRTTGIIIGRSEWKQLAKLWIMCKDDQFIIAVSKQA